MLPEVVWNMPPMGSVNLHGSLLPQYRGAAPINWAVINGEKETGVTTFKLKQEIDTGDILMQEKLSIREDETVGEIHDRMKDIGAKVLVKTVKGLADGTLSEVPQDFLVKESTVNKLIVKGERSSDETMQKNTELPQASTLNLTPQTLHHAPKIFTETCHIDFTKTVDKVFNLIRGLSPYPAAFTFLQGKKLKVYKVEKVNKVPTIAPGDFETNGKTFLQFACADGYISILDLQLEGKKRINIEDFLRGYRFG
jgi:methionyl-tRNA formyltransferase